MANAIWKPPKLIVSPPIFVNSASNCSMPPWWLSSVHLSLEWGSQRLSNALMDISVLLSGALGLTYIADYPEQVLLSCIVQGWCPRYILFYVSILLCNLLILIGPKCLQGNSMITNMSDVHMTIQISFAQDAKWAHYIYENYSIIGDIIVRMLYIFWASLIMTIAFHKWISTHPYTWNYFTWPITPSHQRGIQII